MRPVRTFIKFDFAPHWSGHRAPRLAALARASDRAFLVQCPVKGEARGVWQSTNGGGLYLDDRMRKRLSPAAVADSATNSGSKA